MKNRKFWVSTAVDFGVSVAVGVAAAAVVAGLIALTAPVSLPIAIIATTVLSIGFGLGLEALDIPDKAKNWVNGLFMKGK